MPPGFEDVCASASLHPYQVDAVRFIVAQRNVLLAFDIGLGKTRTAAVAAALAGPGCRPILVIGPKFVCDTWRQEMALIGLAEGGEFYEVKGRLKTAAQNAAAVQEIEGAKVVFCHVDLLSSWADFLYRRHPKAVIADEAHYLRGNSARSRAAAYALDRAPMRILLTATPLVNRYGELWRLLSLTTGQWTWGTLNAFRQRYASAVPGPFGGFIDRGPSHVDELRERMSACYLRRAAAEVRLEMPSITRSVIRVEGRSKAYRAAAKAFVDEEQMDIESAVEAVLEGRASRRTLGWLGKLRAAAALGKVEQVLADAKSFEEQGERVLIFTHQRNHAELLGREFGAGVIHGGLSEHVRAEALEDFGSARSLVATYGALGAGVNLQKQSRIVLFLDLDWAPATLTQAEGRVFRQGQDKPVVARYYAATGTLDDLLWGHLCRKQAWIDAVV